MIVRVFSWGVMMRCRRLLMLIGKHQVHREVRFKDSMEMFNEMCFDSFDLT